VTRHHALARRAAADATVLLPTTGSCRWPRTTARQTLAVIGSFAVSPRYPGHRAARRSEPTRLDDLRWPRAVGAARRGPGRYAARLRPRPPGRPPTSWSRGGRRRRGADVAVVCVGLPGGYESEGFDREHLALPPPATPRLVEAVSPPPPGRGGAVQRRAGRAALGRPTRRARRGLPRRPGRRQRARGRARRGRVSPAGAWPRASRPPWPTCRPTRNFPGHPKQVECTARACWSATGSTTPRACPAAFPFGHGLGYTSSTPGCSGRPAGRRR
jgi:beta-glucosidase